MHKNVETTKYREALREQIIIAASQLFRTNGIRAVKMDDIADSVSCSKRTLYELFADKEELIISVLDYLRAANDRQMGVLLQTEGVMRMLLECFRWQIQAFRTTNPMFYVDAPRYSRVAEHMEHHRLSNRNNILEVFKRAVDEGYFRPDVNYELLLDVFLRRGGGLFNGDLYLKYSFAEIFRNTMMIYVRGLCTEKGLAELDKFNQEINTSKLVNEK